MPRPKAVEPFSLVNGCSVAADAKGYLRCPLDCWTSACDYPPPKWKTAEGLKEHMDGCHMAPPPPIPPPVAADPPAHWGDCPACGDAIFVGESVWKAEGYAFCWGCRNASSEPGFLDCAGLEFPELTLAN